MQAVILCAGRGTRMGDLTNEIPKPLLVRDGVTLLERTLDLLPESIHEIVLVIGYLGHKIRETVGDSHRGREVVYVEQPELNGTAGALWCAQSVLEGRFIVLMADDGYDPSDMQAACESTEWTLFTKDVPEMYRGGNVIIGPDGSVECIKEGNDHGGTPGKLNIGLYTLDTDIFEHEPVPASQSTTELGLPQTMIAASIARNRPCKALASRAWIQVTTPDDLVPTSDE